ncbi:MAG: hypothetical protein M0Z94_16650 [Dehalococcoidales bacterium]|nr:hypothetical protein [Dehalococcoidales bacterium]
MNEVLRVVENEVQLVALAIFLSIYLVRLNWLRSLRSPGEAALPKASATTGVLLSFGSVFLPWTMESTRKHLAVYVEFALFHVAVAIAILASFTLPYAPQLMSQPIVYACIFFLAFGVVAGVVRIRRRLVNSNMRAINTPDDYFAITVITVWFLTALWGLGTMSALGLTVYFGLTALLLVYVPLSKVSHYLYMPFTRFYFGYSFGRRGVTVKKNQWRYN